MTDVYTPVSKMGFLLTPQHTSPDQETMQHLICAALNNDIYFLIYITFDM